MSKYIKQGEKKIFKFAKDLVGNRVLDLYLKYLGITTLTTATLVPVALILGKKEMEKYINNAKKQTGGMKIPILDDPLIGNYLKLAGISTLKITPNTLVPLGILMLVYDLYKRRENQKGGNMKKFIKRIWGNRVLDLFAKYKGIKTLTSATLVPFALILGKDALEDFLKEGTISKQNGGFTIPKDLPILDDPLLGNYLKLAGLSVINLTPGTLIPLGIIAVLYDVYM